MISGLGMRVLLLSLLLGQHANALSYRSGGANNVKSHFELARDFPRSYKPIESAQPGGPVGGYRPASPENAPPEYLNPAAVPGAGHVGGSRYKPVAGYSPEGSVSSNRPGSVLREKPSHYPQNQPDPNVRPYESGIASSYGIEMYSEPLKPSHPTTPQGPSYTNKPQGPSYPSRPQEPSYPNKPQGPSYPSKPQGPSYPSKPQGPSYPSRPQEPSYPSQPQGPSYPSKPQQPSYPSTQSKAGMWDFALTQDDGTPTSSNPRPRGHVNPPRWRQQQLVLV